jgi:hypothetical protein
VFVGNFSSGTDQVKFRLNGDSGTNYCSTWLRSDGASTTADKATGAGFTDLGRGTSMNTNREFISIDIMSYTGSTYKTMYITRNNNRNSSGTIEINTPMWLSTSAVTSFNIFTDVYTFAIGTSVTLYGIKAA